MAETVEDVLERRGKRGEVNIPNLYTAMLNNAGSNAKMVVMERGKFLRERLLQNEGFTEAVKNALERGVKITIFSDSMLLNNKYREDPIINLTYGTYAYGGLENLANCFKQFGATQEKADSMAREFENDLGMKRYLLKVQGILYKLLGKYETMVIERHT